MKPFVLLLVMTIVGSGQSSLGDPISNEVQNAIGGADSHSVCWVLEHGAKLDGQFVTIESTVMVGDHATLLQGKECGKGIYMVHEWGKSGQKWKVLDDALAGQSGGLDQRILRVKVAGLYHDAVPRAEGGPVRKLEVTEVLEVELQDLGHQ